MFLKIDRTGRAIGLLAALMLVWTAPASAEPSSAAEFKVPVEYYKLPNGLRVVLSPDQHIADDLRGRVLPDRVPD